MLLGHVRLNEMLLSLLNIYVQYIFHHRLPKTINMSGLGY